MVSMLILLFSIHFLTSFYTNIISIVLFIITFLLKKVNL
ncbi:MAG: hypothetical protein E7508_01030 [Ruminococcus sp.]|nr:hypothetical protein [Ruminococcus sp.]